VDDLKLYGVITLRGLAMLFGLQGQDSAASALNKLATGIEAGMNVDAHMKTVAEAFKAGTEASWDDITDRIDVEVDEFLNR